MTVIINIVTVNVSNRMVTPRIVVIFYNNATAIVKYDYNNTLVVSVKHCFIQNFLATLRYKYNLLFFIAGSLTIIFLFFSKKS